MKVADMVEGGRLVPVIDAVYQSKVVLQIAGGGLCTLGTRLVVEEEISSGWTRGNMRQYTTSTRTDVRLIAWGCYSLQYMSTTALRITTSYSLPTLVDQAYTLVALLNYLLPTVFLLDEPAPCPH